MVIRKGLIQTMTPEQMLEGGEDATDSEVGGEGQQAARSMRAVFQEQRSGGGRVAKGCEPGGCGSRGGLQGPGAPSAPFGQCGAFTQTGMGGHCQRGAGERWDLTSFNAHPARMGLPEPHLM